MRAVILCRQSLTRSDSVSIPAQEEALRKHATEQGMTVVGVLSAESTRGWWEISQRDEVQQALALAEQRAYDALLVWSIDRLGRNVRIVETIAHELEQHGVTIMSLSEPFVSDPFMRQLMAALGEKFTRDLSARMRGAIAERTQRGRFQGRPPLGYRFAAVEVEGQPVKRLVIDEDGRQRYEQLISWWLDDGLSITDIAARLVREGVPCRNGGVWTYSRVAYVLQNPVYLGLVTHKGQTYPGLHPPLIDEARWQAVQDRFRRLVRVRHKPVASWCEGAVEHVCGAPLYLAGERFPGKPGTALYRYFRCRRRTDLTNPCRSGRYRAERIEQAVLACLAADLGAVVTVEEAIAAGRDATADRTVQRRRDALTRRETAARTRHARARERWLSGREPVEWMDGEDARLAAELAAIADARGGLPATTDQSLLEEAQRGLAALGTQLLAADDDVRAAALREFGTAVVGETVTIRYRTPYNRLIPVPAVVPLPRSPSRTRTNVGSL